jgi:hypothetical protein
MKTQATGFNFWPGYVAAISCLVLGLLLVASIVATLISQLGLIGAKYSQALVAEMLRRAQAPVVVEPARPPAAPAPAPVVSLPAAPAPPPVVVPRDRPALPDLPNYLTLIFGEQLLDIPGEQREDIAQSLRGLTAPPDSRWRIWASAPESDLAQRRNTFRLMVAVRTFLGVQGITESRIELRLENGPVTGAPGDIVIRVGPAAASSGAAAGAGARP